jgi:hypothetical protein
MKVYVVLEEKTPLYDSNGYLLTECGGVVMKDDDLEALKRRFTEMVLADVKQMFEGKRPDMLRCSLKESESRRLESRKQKLIPL